MKSIKRNNGLQNNTPSHFCSGSCEFVNEGAQICGYHFPPLVIIIATTAGLLLTFTGLMSTIAFDFRVHACLGAIFLSFGEYLFQKANTNYYYQFFLPEISQVHKKCNEGVNSQGPDPCFCRLTFACTDSSVVVVSSSLSTQGSSPLSQIMRTIRSSRSAWLEPPLGENWRLASSSSASTSSRIWPSPWSSMKLTFSSNRTRSSRLPESKLNCGKRRYTLNICSFYTKRQPLTCLSRNPFLADPRVTERRPKNISSPVEKDDTGDTEALVPWAPPCGPVASTLFRDTASPTEPARATLLARSSETATTPDLASECLSEEIMLTTADTLSLLTEFRLPTWLVTSANTSILPINQPHDTGRNRPGQCRQRRRLVMPVHRVTTGSVAQRQRHRHAHDARALSHHFIRTRRQPTIRVVLFFRLSPNLVSHGGQSAGNAVFRLVEVQSDAGCGSGDAADAGSAERHRNDAVDVRQQHGDSETHRGAGQKKIVRLNPKKKKKSSGKAIYRSHDSSKDEHVPLVARGVFSVPVDPTTHQHRDPNHDGWNCDPSDESDSQGSSNQHPELPHDLLLPRPWLFTPKQNDSDEDLNRGSRSALAASQQNCIPHPGRLHLSFGHEAQPAAITAKEQSGAGHQRASGSPAKTLLSIKSSYLITNGLITNA
ncbi:unnamed protein product [Notodromas monacha]|uniref:Uncharacterized protein n=1 Tax=Notodromas monacha TaxID=399045 RepID=A0A7R9BYW3_9CRUS|nr:unnamed protein product [Notodromas monacha]CAG0923101.1 unnamed protein product [Notodromas monacha]